MNGEYRLVHGDVNLNYGALFVRDMGAGWAEVVEVTDLDSAVGTTNLVLVEQGTVAIPYKLGSARETFKHSWEACGPGACGRRLSDMDRELARLAGFAAMWEYGYRDVEQSWTLATDREYDEWAGPDRWRVTWHEVYDERLKRKRKLPIRVSGESGLWRWLRRALHIERPAGDDGRVGR